MQRAGASLHSSSVTELIDSTLIPLLLSLASTQSQDYIEDTARTTTSQSAPTMALLTEI